MKFPDKMTDKATEPKRILNRVEKRAQAKAIALARAAARAKHLAANQARPVLTLTERNGTEHKLVIDYFEDKVGGKVRAVYATNRQLPEHTWGMGRDKATALKNLNHNVVEWIKQLNMAAQNGVSEQITIADTGNDSEPGDSADAGVADDLQRDGADAAG